MIEPRKKALRLFKEGSQAHLPAHTVAIPIRMATLLIQLDWLSEQAHAVHVEPGRANCMLAGNGRAKATWPLWLAESKLVSLFLGHLGASEILRANHGQAGSRWNLGDDILVALDLSCWQVYARPLVALSELITLLAA